jgi:hypothetical protein
VEVDRGDAREQLDASARSTYRARAIELAEEIEDAEAGRSARPRRVP